MVINCILAEQSITTVLDYVLRHEVTCIFKSIKFFLYGGLDGSILGPKYAHFWRKNLNVLGKQQILLVRNLSAVKLRSQRYHQEAQHSDELM